MVSLIMPETARIPIETHHLLIDSPWEPCRSKGIPPGPVTPLASVVHAKGNPHVFFEVEDRDVIPGNCGYPAARVFNCFFNDYVHHHDPQCTNYIRLTRIP